MNTLSAPCPLPPGATASSYRRFAMLAAAVLVVFALPLWQLVRFAASVDLHSHILLIPFISAYLWRVAREHPLPAPSQSVVPAAISAALGAVALGLYLAFGRTGKLPVNDALSISTAGFLCFLLAAAFLTLGAPILRARLFAVTFLVFMIPLPLAAIEGLSVFLQYASADLSNVTLRLTGMPVFREGLLFQMPGLRVFVAEECSGIRSTLVLFITSLIAAHLFLRTGWKKAVLALAVIPIGIFRNALRITTISWLTVHVDPAIIDGPLHRRGGPLFFVLSLIPLFILLFAFRRSDRRRENPAKP